MKIFTFISKFMFVQISKHQWKKSVVRKKNLTTLLMKVRNRWQLKIVCVGGGMGVWVGGTNNHFCLRRGLHSNSLIPFSSSQSCKPSSSSLGSCSSLNWSLTLDIWILVKIIPWKQNIVGKKSQISSGSWLWKDLQRRNTENLG